MASTSLGPVEDNVCLIIIIVFSFLCPKRILKIIINYKFYPKTCVLKMYFFELIKKLSFCSS